MKNLFVVGTPYTLSIATGIVAKRFFKDQNDILIRKNFNTVHIDFEKLNNLFDNVYIYDKDKNINIKKGLISHYIETRYIFFKLKRLIGKQKYNRIFLNNDSIRESQYIMNKYSKIKSTEVIYIEDGSNAYIQTQSKKQINNKLEKTLKKIKYGFNLEDIGTVYGTHSKITKRMLLWPQLARKELIIDKKTIESITSEELKLGVGLCYDKVLVNMPKIRGTVILLEHIDYFNSDNNVSLETYKFIISSIISKIILLEKNIYLKYHPRDNSAYMKSLEEKEKNIKNIENSLPIEIFFMHENIKVVSINSTALLTAAKFIDATNIISLIHILNIEDRSIIDCFNTLKIKIPGNITELMDLIC